jgi:hypothetical protein
MNKIQKNNIINMRPINKFAAIKFIKEFNSINSIVQNRQKGGGGVILNTNYRDNDGNLIIFDCIDCREDNLLV